MALPNSLAEKCLAITRANACVCQHVHLIKTARRKSTT